MVAFLILAIIASVVALSLPNPHFNGSGGAVTSRSDSRTTPMPQNAFVLASEDLPIALRENLSGNDTNLTQATAQNLADVITSLNPEGPRDFNGQVGLVLPTSSALNTYLIASAPDFQISDLWSNVQDGDLNMTTASGTAANNRFNEGFKTVMRATISSPTFLSGLSQSANAGASGDIATTLGAAALGLKNLETPAVFVPFEKSFVNYLEDERNLSMAIQNQSVDPLKATIVLNGEVEVTSHVADDILAMAKAYQALDPAKLLSQSTKPEEGGLGEISALFKNLFQINTAFAQVGFSIDQTTGKCTLDSDAATKILTDLGLTSGILSVANLLSGLTSVPVTDASLESMVNQTQGMESISSQSSLDILTLLVYECNRKISTESAKNAAVKTLDSVTLDYIQNKGDPRFIQDYTTFYGDAATRGATAAYKDVSAQICPEFVSDVKTTVFNPDTAAGPTGQTAGDILLSDSAGGGPGPVFGSPTVNGTGAGCGIKNQISDMQGFYNDFSSDPNAWSDYYSLTSDPTNNLFGTIAVSHDAIDSSAQSAATAAQAESVANQGYKSTAQCLTSYTDSNGNKICTKQQIVTPGSVGASQVAASANSAYGQVASANDLTQLNRAITDAMGVQLMKGKAQGLYNLTLKLGSGNPITIQDVCTGLSNPGPCNSMTAEINKINAEIASVVGKVNSVINIINKLNSILNFY